VPLVNEGYKMTVNLADHAKLDGSWELNNFVTGGVTVNGGKGSEFIVNATDIIRGVAMKIDADVGGHGTFILAHGQYRYGMQPPGTLEFGGKVANGVHVDIAGNDPNSMPATAIGLTIDHPNDFKGSITLHGGVAGREVDLKDMAKAASWSFRDDVLTIADAKGHAIDKLHIDDQASGFNGGLALSRTATGDVLVSPGTDFHGLLALPTS